ncbi:hypothetical protein ACFPH6_14705 [Streptomyces xiangluensis]|uniref:Uncharacterized protein n=1 Tax=Streptomyces xiangluensis TaxID=2665720 RepID=A0ABV8YKF3_9ACTN
MRATSASQLALDAAEKFTAFCARRVIITRASLHYPEKLTLVEPRPWRVKRHSPEAWWFAGTAYGQFLTQQSSLAPTPSPVL